MSKYILCNQKYRTLEKHIHIKNELDEDTSLKDIVKFLCKDLTTIFKKVTAYRLANVQPDLQGL